MKAYSLDLRQKVLAAALRGDRTIREVANSFGVGTIQALTDISLPVY
jgi:transposase